MKTYAKPTLMTEEFTAEDIISTSSLIPGGEGTNDNPMEWSLRPSAAPSAAPAVAVESLFEN